MAPLDSWQLIRVRLASWWAQWLLVAIVAAHSYLSASADESPPRTRGNSAVGMSSDKSRRQGEFPDEVVQVGATARTYRLYVPETVKRASPAPLVIAFHGILIDSKDLMPLYTKLNDTARRHGFLVVYPNAVGRSWGLTPDKIKADLAFFDALLAALRKDYSIDSQRVHVLGMSNGGYFAHLLGKERSQVIASVASHSGPLGLQTLLGIGAERKFPVMIIHGGRDPLFAISIARENRDKYRREGHEVEYVELPNLGHRWATEADINERIWSFFKSHIHSSKKQGRSSRTSRRRPQSSSQRSLAAKSGEFTLASNLVGTIVD
jgi:poly(3-hydroxybutyrate) depolymerase